MAAELRESHVLPQYADAIRQAKQNLASPEAGSVGKHDLWPPTRQRPRTFDKLAADEQTRAVFMRVFTGQHVRTQ